MDIKLFNVGYGNFISVDHGNGYVTLYGHAKSLAVSAGQRVTMGQTKNHFPMQDTGKYHFSKTICFSLGALQKATEIHLPTKH